MQRRRTNAGPPARNGSTVSRTATRDTQGQLYQDGRPSIEAAFGPNSAYSTHSNPHHVTPIQEDRLIAHTLAPHDHVQNAFDFPVPQELVFAEDSYATSHATLSTGQSLPTSSVPSLAWGNSEFFDFSDTLSSPTSGPQPLPFEPPALALQPEQGIGNTERWTHYTNFDYNPSAVVKMQVPSTDKDIEDAVQLYGRRMIANGQDPITDNDRMTMAANAFGIDVATFVMATCKAFYRPSGNTAQRRPAGEDKAACKQAIAQAYVDEARRRGCNQEPPRPSSGGKYRCIWPKCNFTHKRTDEWKRHILAHRPYEVFVCDRCLDSSTMSDRGRGKPFTNFRHDKCIEHLQKRHGISIATHNSAIAEVSRVPFPNNFEPRCTYAYPGTGEACQHRGASAQDMLVHWAAHFKAESGGAIQRSGSKRPSSRPGLRQAEAERLKKLKRAQS